MTVLKITEFLKNRWGIASVCSLNKNESEVLRDEILKIKEQIRNEGLTKEEVDFLKKYLNEKKLNNIIVISMLIYPDKPLVKAMKSLYHKLKDLIENEGEASAKEVLKYIRLENADKIRTEMNVNILAKAALVKKILENKSLCEG